jgi:hypothetical protein
MKVKGFAADKRERAVQFFEHCVCENPLLGPHVPRRSFDQLGRPQCRNLCFNPLATNSMTRRWRELMFRLSLRRVRTLLFRHRRGRLKAKIGCKAYKSGGAKFSDLTHPVSTEGLGHFPRAGALPRGCSRPGIGQATRKPRIRHARLDGILTLGLIYLMAPR